MKRDLLAANGVNARPGLIIDTQFDQIVSVCEIQRRSSLGSGDERRCLTGSAIVQGQCDLTTWREGDVAASLLSCIVVQQHSGGFLATRHALAVDDGVRQVASDPHPDDAIRIHDFEFGHGEHLRWQGSVTRRTATHHENGEHRARIRFFRWP